VVLNLDWHNGIKGVLIDWLIDWLIASIFSIINPLCVAVMGNRDWDLNRSLNHFGNSTWDVKIWFETLWFDLRHDLKILRFDWKEVKSREIEILFSECGAITRVRKALLKAALKEPTQRSVSGQWRVALTARVTRS